MKIEDLPEVNFIDTDTDTVRENLISTFEDETGRSLAPADPERLFLEAQAVIIGQLRVEMNEGAKQNLLAYAVDDYLEHLGVFVDSEREVETPAVSTVLFSIEEAQTERIVIEEGTRVSPDGELFFSTDEEAYIEIGETSIEVGVTCMENGTVGNGYLSGQIKKLVDLVPYISSVSNNTISSGGTEKESDDSYRENINDAPSSFSTTGPKEAYEYLAKTAHPDILDVTILSPEDGVIQICVLMEGGELPDESFKSLVLEACSSNDRRPLTDKVTVIDPTQINYTPSVSYYLYESDSDNISNIQEKVELAFSDYLAWQKEKLGRDISPDAIIQVLKNAGAKRVVLSSPDHTVIAENEIAKEVDPKISYQGVESE